MQPTNLFPLFCGDIFCRSCLAQEVREVLSTRRVPLRCCDIVVPHDFIREVLEHEEDVYYSFLLNLPRGDEETGKGGSATTKLDAKSCAVPLLPAGEGAMNATNELEMKRPAVLLQNDAEAQGDPDNDLRYDVAAAIETSLLEQWNSMPVIPSVQPVWPRYFTRGSKARLAAKQESKPSGTAPPGEPGATEKPPVALPAQTSCRVCGKSEKESRFKAPCGHELCHKCVETGVRRYLEAAPNDNTVPVNCCGTLLSLDIVLRVIAGPELTAYAKRMMKYAPATTGVTSSTTRGGKRKAAPEKQPTRVARTMKKSKGKAPAKKAKTAVDQSQENERVCMSCYSQVASADKWRVVPCGHGYCLSCLKKMAKTSLANREQVPIRCCSKEFPVEYVKFALTKAQFDQYTRFNSERDPRASTLQSDRDYATVVRKTKGKQCPRCGIGVVKVAGCNAIRCPLGHSFCWVCLRARFLPKLDELKEFASAEHAVYVNSDTIDEVDVEVQLADVYVLELYREEIRRAEQVILDEGIALSFYAKEERKLLHPTDADLVTDSEEGDALVLVEVSDLLAESKPLPSCTCCLALLEDEATRRILTCGHIYCTKCIATRCRMGVRDRSMVPAHCCKREFPSDYVIEALDAVEFEIYERFLKDKPWRSLDLQSDRDYAKVVQQHYGVQCPGCGVGVQKVTGCNHMTCLNGHEFCFLCTSKWKTCVCQT
ncbi:hypothetical protein PHYPSEUDO_008979 [Phytophthora pseudosyringae]|uniref:RING-type domain-containing protein n=1 Tax=Phytophthora pseudosyringae TaxID=221518 RepID=A0A8T1W908_9STRA|nr:hypothetical protein PHYPSEUDO_008979 [Phytophthora pseudosyringae]